MTISKRKAERCTTHHFACDCREYKMQEMEQALRIIRTWAHFDAKNPTHVAELCDKALNCLRVKEKI